MALPDSSRDRAKAFFGGADLGPASHANVAPGGAQSVDAERDDDARMRALVLESADGLMLASELAGDETARASLRRHADERVAWSEAYVPLSLRA